MEQPRSLMVWEIVYPFLLFEAVILLAQEVFAGLSLADGMLGQAIATVLAGIVLWYRMLRKGKLKLLQQNDSRNLIKGLLAAAVVTVISGVGMNLLLLSISALRTQEQFQAVNQYFFGAALWLELLTLGIITPCAEELLFRGIIYKRLRNSFGIFASVMVSSIFFGVYHLNLTQMLYSCVIGVILALQMEVYKDIRVPMLGHMAINMVVVLNGELGILDRTILSTTVQKNISMVICLVLMIIFAGVLGKKCTDLC